MQQQSKESFENFATLAVAHWFKNCICLVINNLYYFVPYIVSCIFSLSLSHFFLYLTIHVLLTYKYQRRRQLSNPIGHHTLQSLRQLRLGTVFEHALQTDTQWAGYVGDNGHLQSVCQTGHRAKRQMLMYSKQHLGYAEFPLWVLHWI